MKILFKDDPTLRKIFLEVFPQYTEYNALVINNGKGYWIIDGKFGADSATGWDLDNSTVPALFPYLKANYPEMLL